MFINNFDPVAFTFFSLEIRWYSLAYIFGIIFGWIYCKKLIKDVKLQYLFDNYISYLIVGIILGGRLGYVIFYNFSYYLKNPIEIFMIWNGGMSFHGAIIGIIICSYFFSKKYKMQFFLFLDLVAISSPIGIFFGRIANFINGELFGLPTDKPWGVIFPKIDNILRHPSQIYEAILEGVILFLILNFFIKRKFLNHGGISFLFLILYGIFRIISEKFRQPDEQIGYLLDYISMGTLLSIFMIIIGSIYLYRIILNGKNR